MSDRKMHTSQLHYLFIKVLWKKNKTFTNLLIQKSELEALKTYKSLKHFQSRQSVMKNKTEMRMFLLRVGPALNQALLVYSSRNKDFVLRNGWLNEPGMQLWWIRDKRVWGPELAKPGFFPPFRKQTERLICVKKKRSNKYIYFLQ